MKKKTLLFASLCLAIGAAIVPAHAQENSLQVKVPFNFSVSGRTFPAGDYKVVTESRQLRLLDANGRTIAMAVGTNASSPSGRDKSELIFNCYNNRCFLSEVWSSLQDSGLDLARSEAERELAKEMAQPSSRY